MHSGLIDKFGKIIACPYYEIENVCIQIVKEYCSQSQANNQAFLDFSNDYTYFSPYFDFVLTILGYKVINPFDLPNAVLYSKDNTIYLQHLNDDLELFPLGSDKNISLHKLTKENLDIAMVDANLMAIRPNNYGHVYISRMILHYYFIKEEALYKEYLNERNGFYLYDYASFLIRHKPFIRLEKSKKNNKNYWFSAFKEHDVFYSLEAYEENLSEEQEKFIEKLVDEGILLNENKYIISEENKIGR